MVMIAVMIVMMSVTIVVMMVMLFGLMFVMMFVRFRLFMVKSARYAKYQRKCDYENRGNFFHIKKIKTNENRKSGSG